MTTIIESEYGWSTEEFVDGILEDVPKVTTFEVEAYFIPGKYSGPYEDSYPDESGFEIKGWEGDEPTDEVIADFEYWFEKKGFDTYDLLGDR